MQQVDPREAELVAVAARVLAGLIVAVRHGDHPAAAVEIGKLLNAVSRYNAAMTERLGDEALRRAVSRLP